MRHAVTKAGAVFCGFCLAVSFVITAAVPVAAWWRLDIGRYWDGVAYRVSDNPQLHATWLTQGRLSDVFHCWQKPQQPRTLSVLGSHRYFCEPRYATESHEAASRWPLIPGDIFPVASQAAIRSLDQYAHRAFVGEDGYDIKRFYRYRRDFLGTMVHDSLERTDGIEVRTAGAPFRWIQQVRVSTCSTWILADDPQLAVLAGPSFKLAIPDVVIGRVFVLPLAVNVIALAVLLAACAWGARQLRRAWRRHAGLCARCAYPASAASPRCPECGFTPLPSSSPRHT